MTQYAHLHLEIPKMSMVILAIDTIGKLPVTSKGHCYALTAICLHTLFIFAIPLKEQPAKHLVHAYLKGIIAKVGGSCAILSDNGMEFCKKGLIATGHQLGIKQIYCCVIFFWYRFKYLV